jgi:transcriptional regulator with XRE-family HTH domain
METTVKERLVKFIKYKGLSQKRFEEKVGLSNGYVNNIRRSITVDKLQKIALCFPELNKAWLITGDGEMLNSDVTPVRHSELKEFTETKAGLKFYEREDGQLIMKVPVVPIAALGSPEDEFAELIRDYEGDTVSVVVDAVHHGSYVAFRVDGSSMDDGTHDSFERGDIVVVRELSRDKWLPKLHFKDWPYWVVCFGNNVRLKQIVAHDGPTITCHSINPSPEYTDFTLNLDDVQRLFNVVKKVPKVRNYGI